MRLYVVNCTAQTRQVYYRLDYSLDPNGNRINGQNIPPKFLDIPPGAQIPFGADFNPIQLERVVQQLEKTAGAVSVSDIKTAKTKGVVKLLWSQGVPVARAICKDVQAHNMGRLEAVGEIRRKNLAVNVDFGLRQISESLGNPQEPGFETEVYSVGKEDPEMTAPPIAEEIRVEKSGRPPSRRRAA
jgi:hypothetical protein